MHVVEICLTSVPYYHGIGTMAIIYENYEGPISRWAFIREGIGPTYFDGGICPGGPVSDIILDQNIKTYIIHICDMSR